MSSHGSSITGLGAESCQSDSAVIRPGQSVVGAVSDTLPAHMDITEISTALTGDGRLRSYFIFGMFRNTGVFQAEYPGKRVGIQMEVSIDVDNDPETVCWGLNTHWPQSFYAVLVQRCASAYTRSCAGQLLAIGPGRRRRLSQQCQPGGLA